jgi:molybdate transport system substrate-binding protein
MPAAEITVRSGGSGDPALEYVAVAFHKATGCKVAITYDNNIDEDEHQVFDVVVASADALERQFRPAGRVENEGIPVGRIGLGVAIREGAPAPAIADLGELTASLAAADAFLVTTHSSGLFLEARLKELGLFDLVEPRLERFPNGPLLMERLLAGKGVEFAILGMNQIKRYKGRRLLLVGPAPEEVQHYISFVAVPMRGSKNRDMAWRFAEYLAGPGRPLMLANGFN